MGKVEFKIDDNFVVLSDSENVYLFEGIKSKAAPRNVLINSWIMTLIKISQRLSNLWLKYANKM